ncbi:MAG TPA: hypothetical protein VKM55_30265 [Candidatus Lokiarchaeia archaeon]|nr:hypothetical protein [Candidatus Lokiarchaeia archaeon]
MKTLDFDKNDILAFNDDLNDEQFLNAKLEILTRIRQNLLEKVAEIDTKISTIKNSS